MRRFLLAVLALCLGCGSDGVTPTDATSIDSPHSGPCWPDLVHTPRGSASLGTGDVSYEPIQDTLQLWYGAQDGYNFVVRSRMSGFEPGSETNVFDPRNPRTRVRAYFDDTNVPLVASGGCPYRFGYKQAGRIEYDAVSSLAIIFDTCWRASNLIGKRFRIELEIMDEAGGYASDTKIVTATPPEGEYPEEPGAPGCVQ